MTNQNKSLKWRFIPLRTYSAAMNMAMDESLSESVKMRGDPVIRFYQWNPSAVSIGCFQSMNDEINIKKCKELGIDFIRRRTGGGAVYHDFQGEITYSVIIFEKDMNLGIIESYKEICNWIVEGLKLLGISSEFKPINDIVVNKNGCIKKISGNAQTRRGGVILQHGTILYDVDIEKMFSVLKVSDEKIKDKMIQNVKERVTSIKQLSNVTKQETYQALVNGFLADKNYYASAITEQELKRAEQLVKERYSKDEWNFER